VYALKVFKITYTAGRYYMYSLLDISKL